MKTINYSTVTMNDLEEAFDITAVYDKEIFNEWFNSNYDFSLEENEFLEKLIKKNIKNINNYTELELISKFIAPILNKIDFEFEDKAIRDFYESPLKYEYKDLSFTGRCDFVIAKGYDKPTNPYFFIQEFKQSSASFPEYQLISELIVAMLINNTTKIKGAYIVGSLWTFVIMEKIQEDKYQYFVSKNYDSKDIDELKQIYKNLQFVKQEIYENN
jgi:hypothetical protein